MAYPGDGYQMSNYGVKSYTPEQMKEQWRESVERENKATKAMRKAALEDVDVHQPVSYFNNKKSHAVVSAYDRTFHVKEGYSSKLKRDDLQHTQGLNVRSEEEGKSVPILTSSVYGHKQALEGPDRKNVRVGLVKREFYRSCGTNITG